MDRGRKLKLKRRAERMEETRRRIVEATVALHTTVGPARTSISAIAMRAGVQRLTVYRHFPDERSLFRACTSYGFAANPPPDPAAWRQIADPEARLRTALAEQYGYLERNEVIWTTILPDAPVKPLILEMWAPYVALQARMREALATGWNARGPRRTQLRATLALALEFHTWQTLVRQQGLTTDEAVELMVRLVRCAAESAGSR